MAQRKQRFTPGRGLKVEISEATPDPDTPRHLRHNGGDDVGRVLRFLNDSRVILCLLAAIFGLAVWARDVSRDVERIDRYGTESLQVRADKVDRKFDAVSKEMREMRAQIETLNRNLMVLGARWNVKMEELEAQ